jgi:intracellular sulfur oxidation DsrE/DsrF family protein
MLSLGKVPSRNIKIVASIHGDASFLTLNNEAYQKKFGKPNPNLDIIDKLRANGVNLFVCSQATASRNIDYESINKKVTPALSGLSVLATYQLGGYVYMPY